MTAFQHEMRAAPAWVGAYVWWWNHCKIWAITIYTSILRWWMRLPGQAGAARCCHRAKCFGLAA